MKLIKNHESPIYSGIPVGYVLNGMSSSVLSISFLPVCPFFLTVKHLLDIVLRSRGSNVKGNCLETCHDLLSITGCVFLLLAMFKVVILSAM